MRWIALATVLGFGCGSPTASHCGDGRWCPEGTQCGAGDSCLVLAGGCFFFPDGTPCVGPVNGICAHGVCGTSRCGDQVLDPTTEECDRGGANSDAADAECRTDCTPRRCGDGVEDTGEACDDGRANSDVDPDACRTTCVAASCGDGVLDEREAGWCLGRPWTEDVGASVGDAVLADLDGDGDLEVALSVVVGAGAAAVRVHLVDDGVLGPAVVHPTGGSQAGAVVAGDLEPDGDVDLVTAVGDGVVAIRNAGGVLGAEVGVGLGGAVRDLALGDVDGDGDLDVLVVTDADTWMVETNGGALVVGARVVGTPGESLTTGDVDGDGDLDAIVAHQVLATFEHTLLRGAGDGTFTAEPLPTTGAAPTLADVVVGDMTLDLLVLEGGVTIHQGVGDGSFGPSITRPADAPLAIHAVDVDRDGRLDVVLPGATVLTVFFMAEGEPIPPPSGVMWPMGVDLVATAVGDLDGDRVVDLVGVGPRTLGGLYGGDGPVVRAGRVELPLFPTAATTALGDVDEDGRADLVTLEGVLRGLGDGSFAPPVPLPFALTMPSALALADLGGDGDLDVLVVGHDLGGMMVTLLGDGRGGFVRGPESALPPSPISVAVAPLLAPASPLFALTHGDLLNLWGAGAAGSFRTDVSDAGGVGLPASGPARITAANLTPSPGLEVLVASEAGGLYVYAHDATPRFDPTPIFRGSGFGGGDAGDLDGDGVDGGLDDVVTVDPDTGEAVVLEVMQSQFLVTGRGLGVSLVGPRLADVNGDGVLDLVGAADAGVLRVVLGAGVAEFGGAQDFPAIDGRPLVVGDLDGNGAADVITRAGDVFLGRR